MKRTTRLTVIIGVCFLVLFGVLQIWRDSSLLHFSKSPSAEKVIEILRTQIVGYDQARVSFRIRADYIWGGKNDAFVWADRVHSGQVFNADGSLVIDEIQAGTVEVNVRNKIINANRYVFARFLPRERAENADESPTASISSQKPSVEKPPRNAVYASEFRGKPVDITAENLRYFSTSKRTYMSRNVVITQGDAEIRTDAIEVDNDRNIAYVDTPFVMKKDNITVTGNRMIITIDDESADMVNGVSGYMEATVTTNPDLDDRERMLRARRTMIKANRMTYFNGVKRPDGTTEKGDRFYLYGKVRIWQDDKNMSGEYAEYSRASSIFEIRDNVKFNAEDMVWLIKKEKRQSFTNPDMQKAVYEPFHITCQSMKFDTDGRMLQAFGNIHLFQKDKEAWCDMMQYTDKTGLLMLSGKVRAKKKNGDRLTTSLVLINVNDEVFDARQGVKASFKPRKKDESAN